MTKVTNQVVVRCEQQPPDSCLSGKAAPLNAPGALDIRIVVLLFWCAGGLMGSRVMVLSKGHHATTGTVKAVKHRSVWPEVEQERPPLSYSVAPPVTSIASTAANAVSLFSALLNVVQDPDAWHASVRGDGLPVSPPTAHTVLASSTACPLNS